MPHALLRTTKTTLRTPKRIRSGCWPSRRQYPSPSRPTQDMWQEDRDGSAIMRRIAIRRESDELAIQGDLWCGQFTVDDDALLIRWECQITT
ncbi:cytochrome p450 [Moniliophthora roreri]|nr:cytochrome p450 [Moniliophthora roreri]